MIGPTSFRLSFAATSCGSVGRLAGWVCYHDGAWWVKRHVCAADRSRLTDTVGAIHPVLLVLDPFVRPDATEPAPWVQAKTRAGCVRYLARAVLKQLEKDPADGQACPDWPAHVHKRAKLALKLGGRIFNRRGLVQALTLASKSYPRRQSK